MLQRVDAELAGARVEIGPREARWIAEAALTRAGPEEVERVAVELARRRAAGEPLQYVLGSAAFRNLELEVGPGVLVPRPETEVVVEHAAARLPQGGRLVDIGTGSGAIAFAVKQERADAQVWATDDSEEALAYARRNRGRLGLDVTILEGELFDPLDDSLAGTIDVVVSNPPYVAEGDFIASDVAEHEPHHALFAGADGLVVIEQLAAQTRRWLRPGGWLVCEIAEGLGRAVAALFVRHGYTGVEVHPDLTGRDRIAVGSLGGSGGS